MSEQHPGHPHVESVTENGVVVYCAECLFGRRKEDGPSGKIETQAIRIVALENIVKAQAKVIGEMRDELKAKGGDDE